MTDVLAVVLIFIGLLICYIGIRVYHLLNAKGRAKELSIQVIAKATKRTYVTAAWRLTENGTEHSLTRRRGHHRGFRPRAGERTHSGAG